MKEILDLAIKAIDNNSGGMKFMELLPAILEQIKNLPHLGWFPQSFPDELLEAIKADSRFKVFEYYWKLGEDTVRVKYFITLTYGERLTRNSFCRADSGAWI